MSDETRDLAEVYATTAWKCGHSDGWTEAQEHYRGAIERLEAEVANLRASLAHGPEMGAPEGEPRELHGWEVEYGATVVVCPDCAFTMGAEHTDSKADSYTCPNCQASDEIAPEEEPDAPSCPDVERGEACTCDPMCYPDEHEEDYERPVYTESELRAATTAAYEDGLRDGYKDAQDEMGAP